jgi:hypothetical protein
VSACDDDEETVTSHESPSFVGVAEGLGARASVVRSVDVIALVWEFPADNPSVALVWEFPADNPSVALVLDVRTVPGVPRRLFLFC